MRGAPDSSSGPECSRFTGVERSLVLRMMRTPFNPTVNAAELQPLIGVAAKYKVLDKPYPAAQLISEAAVK